ncbi:hypothetical protein A7U60_g2472 [Sanghuangporus baumii]|uniref:DUF6533 domain-containing protein n=1 Tax=Sanghuangporus baumii TaxID=108892 RepID=A0A9Q5I259_SANBA|nr:hypothetical protein A7U60_g2472 [Sanghuangporus baumii]
MDFEGIITQDRDLNALRYLTLAGTVVLAYDSLLTMPEEIRLIWPAIIFVLRQRTCFKLSATNASNYRLQKEKKASRPSQLIPKLIFICMKAIMLGAAFIFIAAFTSPVVQSKAWVLHSFVGTPYYSWKYSHRQHHRFNGHIEKDEHYVPKVLDADQPAHGSGFWEAVEDTPIFQVIKLAFHQIFGFQSYLLVNASGQARYSGWTSHFNPFCALYRRSQRFDIILSDVGLLLNLAFLAHAARTPPLSTGAVMRLYGIPWILLNNWIAMIVSLQHTDIMLPRYRDGAYTFARGALVTVDRELLGWQGKFFLHYASPCFSRYHLEEATQYARKVLGDDYISCDTSGFKALWENALRCQYVDAKGDTVFYKDKTGSARLRTACEDDLVPMWQ